MGYLWNKTSAVLIELGCAYADLARLALPCMSWHQSTRVNVDISLNTVELPFPLQPPAAESPPSSAHCGGRDTSSSDSE